jgi:hypothetical protein
VPTTLDERRFQPTTWTMTDSEVGSSSIDLPAPGLCDASHPAARPLGGSLTARPCTAFRKAGT